MTYLKEFYFTLLIESEFWETWMYFFPFHHYFSTDWTKMQLHIMFFAPCIKYKRVVPPAFSWIGSLIQNLYIFFSSNASMHFKLHSDDWFVKNVLPYLKAQSWEHLNLCTYTLKCCQICIDTLWFCTMHAICEYIWLSNPYNLHLRTQHLKTSPHSLTHTQNI